MRAHWSLAVGLLVVAAASLVAKEPSQEEIEREMKKFVGMSPDDVRRYMGPPTEETTYLCGGRKEPVLTYSNGKGATLSIYFSKGTYHKAVLTQITRRRGIGAAPGSNTARRG